MDMEVANDTVRRMEGYIRVSRAISDQLDTIIESSTMTTPN